uniref:5-hydroxytryptamine receptor 3A-like n=1 Tax=Leptobrachium leishanense TaxID=445787 RepID=A0A8C5PMJ0_9ANUR
MSIYAVCLFLTAFLVGACHSRVCSYQDLLSSLNLTDLPGLDVRPVKDWTKPSVVYVNVIVYTIVSLDTRLQTLTTYIWFSMAWRNEFISWNPDDFCGIDKMFVYSDIFWHPDIYIYEMVDEAKYPVIPYYIVHSNGKIVSDKPLRIITSCKLNIYKFPFDMQSCTLSLGPYIHPISQIEVLPKVNSRKVFANSMEIFVNKGEWTFMDIVVANGTVESENVTYSQVIYTITLKRDYIVYLVDLIIPSYFLVFLDFASMFMPTGSERLSFKISIVLGFSVLLVILFEILPNSETLPVLGIFCCACMGVMVVSIVGSVFTSYMNRLSNNNNESNVLSSLKIWIIKYLAPVLGFRLKLSNNDLATTKNCKVSKKLEEILEVQNKVIASATEADISPEVKQIKNLLIDVLKIHQELVLARTERDTRSEWQVAAIVVDRLILIVHLIALVAIFLFVVSVWAT